MKCKVHVKIFVNPAGQRDNIGDSALRRPFLDALRERGELHICVGRDLDYASGLGIQSSDVLYRSRLRWLVSAVRWSLLRKLTFAVNAGEVVGSRQQWRRSSWQPVLAWLARATGGDVLLTGVSIRPGSPIQLTHLRALAGRARLATWRDEATMKEVGSGVVQPDWAFSLGGDLSQGQNRVRLAICLRGDRIAPSVEFAASLRDFAVENKLELWVVVQVRRDRESAMQFAERVGAQVLDWPEHVTHAQHEPILRDFYRTCLIVVSDRIHALIIGLTEGAAPLGLARNGHEKISRTFGPVAAIPIVDTVSRVDAEVWTTLVRGRNPIMHAASIARARVRDVQQELGDQGVQQLRHGLSA